MRSVSGVLAMVAAVSWAWRSVANAVYHDELAKRAEKGEGLAKNSLYALVFLRTR